MDNSLNKGSATGKSEAHFSVDPKSEQLKLSEEDIKAVGKKALEKADESYHNLIEIVHLLVDNIQKQQTSDRGKPNDTSIQKVESPLDVVVAYTPRPNMY